MILFACLFLLFSCSQQKPTIYIVASYDEQDVCGIPQVEGVKDALKELRDFSIKEFYLDARRISKEQLQDRCDRVAQEIKTTKILKAIITVDDAAMQCAAKHFMGKKVPVIFSGINITPEEYNKKYYFLNGRTPIKNFTGVYEYLFIKRQFALLEILVKDVKNVAVLYSTDLVGEALKNQVLKEVDATPYKDRIILYPVSNLTDLDKAIKEIASKKDMTAYFPFVMSIDGNGKRLTFQDVSPMLQRKIKKIDLAINEAFVNFGFFGGVSVDFYQMGYRAGEIAKAIVKGRKVSDFDVEDAQKYVKILNLKRANEIDVKFDDNIKIIFDKVVK